jgi:hypothetical protein
VSAPKVDAMAWLDELCRDSVSGICDYRGTDAYRVRAAVAELIEAARSALYDMREVRDRCTSLVAVGLDEQVGESIEKLAEALARIGGES